MKHSRLIYINPLAEDRAFTTKWQSKRKENIEIWNPPFSFLPTRYGIHRLREKFSAHSLEQQVVKELGADWRQKTIMYVTPTTLEQSYEYVSALNPEKLILDILDDNLNFPSISEEKKIKLTEMLRSISEQATTVTAVSQYLVDQTKQLLHREDIHYLPNGVDVKMFKTIEDGELADIEAIPHPRVTFVGAITTWIDLPLIERVANMLADTQFILIGPIDPAIEDDSKIRKLKSMENVHFLGAKPYNQVPQYLHASDVLLLPRTMDPYSLACDPLKLYEYLATGKPVVSTNHPSINRFLDFVYTGKTDEEIALGIREALTRGKESIDLQQSVINSLSWETRMNQLMDLVNKNERKTVSLK